MRLNPSVTGPMPMPARALKTGSVRMRNAIDLQQDGGMAEPRGMQTGIGPGLGIGTMGRGQNLAPGSREQYHAGSSA